ncbi:CoA transferase subunit A [Prauserella muralis]|uniref:Succinyl-CoA--3-ketoacid-CoA transferase n=1 Tax=Prauserella muralis TaxID=588067 RepID=A0A2V4AUA9_9PSEU|nr:CoA transferase subunit A [Prauserella muralis]PXY24629.1 succinyl-CoA--3-ketoacid-CoA transferase [Prauserella muralis]TWE27684.1 3-oxoacid CoA-transferase subunit A [Prauserella muralis]
MPTVHRDAAEALTGVLADGITIAVGGFGLSGNPHDLIEAVRDSGVRDLTIVSNNMGVDGAGLGLLLENRQVRRVLASYVGENTLFAQQYLDGELEVEFVPQGTLAERMRAGGAGIPAFYTRTGVGTPVAEGKPHAEFDGVTYVRERGIVADLALVHAHTADRAGNLTYRYAARNFNPLVATCGRVSVAEAEIVVADAFLDPDSVLTPGVYVDRLVAAAGRVKRIEKLTVRPRAEV